MIILAFFWVLVIAITGLSVLCFFATINRSVVCVPNPGALCSSQYDPVCGVDDRTYANECEAHKRCVTVLYEGACGD